jgi:hypothetical protein
MTTRVRYTGSPRYVGAVAQMLEEEDVQVDYTPTDTRGPSPAAETVTVYYICQGTPSAIRAGIQKFRERFGRGVIEVEVNKGG